MSDLTIEREQHSYARLAGWMYFLNYVTAMFGVIVPTTIGGAGNFASKARNILASEHMYRFAIASMTISWVLIVVLAFSLFVVLRPVNKRLAQLALLMELAQAAVGAASVMFSFAIVEIRLPAAAANSPFADEQLRVIETALRAAAANGFHITMIFLAVGSTIFFHLFYKSRYVPRLLAGWGVFASIVLVIVSIASLTFPEYAARLQYGWGPIGIAEVSTALWLMIVGIRTPAPASGMMPAPAT